MSTPLGARSSNDMDPYSASHIYYGPESTHVNRANLRTRTFSTIETSTAGRDSLRSSLKKPHRRGSHDEPSLTKPGIFTLPVDKTIEHLRYQEDTDGNWQITVEDDGPKVISVGTASSNGFQSVELRGTYLVSTLFQELHLAKGHGLDHIVLDYNRLNENPVHRMQRLIKDEFWQNLTRRIDASAIEIAGKDPKDWTDDPRPRIYVPKACPEQFEYYTKAAQDYPELRLDVCWLPAQISPETMRHMESKPGLLALEMEKFTDPETGKEDLRGLPFVVPGGRFNELYGWDSYMESLGLIASGRVDLAKAMVQNFCFCIKHYGKILNANRSYYLTRSQPPFLTDMTLRVYEKIENEPGAKDFLRQSILAAIKEYHSVWISEPRLDPITGLSRYRPAGFGIPQETEAAHFTHLLEPYAAKHNMTFTEFVQAYNNKVVIEPELDEYFLHDRAVRESGHDTSYRLERVCANLATIDLNSLLYKYETDISKVIRNHFKDNLEVPAEFCAGAMKPGQQESSSLWDRRAKNRKAAMDKYLWNPKRGMYFDYDTVKKQQCIYESATTFWGLWAGAASPAQAARLVESALPLFEKAGGLVSGTEESRGRIGLDRPNRQWDYPYGWAPQQMLAWDGLQRYGYIEEAQRIAYRWLFMMTTAYVDYNGVIVEKYDVTKVRDPHKVTAEYGNQGLVFKGVAREGFGWVNASYVYGMNILNTHMRRALGNLASWEQFWKATSIPGTIVEGNGV